MMRLNSSLALGFTLWTVFASATSLVSRPAFALDNILHPYATVRSSGMGGLRITTGLYEENFFSNPARVTQNPQWRLTVLDLTAETTSTTLSTISELTKKNVDLAQIASTAGKNLHARIQTTLPAYYLPHPFGSKMSYAVGFLMSTQTDVILGNNYQFVPSVVTDIGPAITVGRTFLPNDELSVGITGHLTYRLGTTQAVSFLQLLQGQSLSPSTLGGDGAQVDFDLGGTYDLPFNWNDWKFSTALTINDLLGGAYTNVGIHKLDPNANGDYRAPPAQPRAFGLGVSMTKPELGQFKNTLVALEVTDMGNNLNGSFFRLLHIGAETRYGVLLPRVGINQGYWTAGLGLDLKALQIDVSTYGEEMSLNTGGYQDRRFALKLGIGVQ